jgi:rifampicin phosphotransferase
MAFVRSLASLGRTDLALAGGKAANLGALLAAGLPVPPGFCITTDAYRRFLADNRLDGTIAAALDGVRLEDAATLDAASERLRDGFQAGRLPVDLREEILAAYRALPGAEVAVRSSATAEDLPELSFAGQQDTFLNVVGDQALLDAVVRCWASLWTARAIGYRARNDVATDELALAVVVQCMVDSEASGVLFTANPLTGRRSEVVIDATFGLGEALVSGQVEPDHYVVELGGRIVEKRLGSKAVVMRTKTQGGTSVSARPAALEQALPDEAIAGLAELGRRAEALFGGPQDVEWASAGGRLSLLQSRPVTSLYPLPMNVAAEPTEVLLSFGVWQGMLDPLTPLGRDLWASAVSGFARAFGYRIEPEAQRALLTAGDRFFVNLTSLWGTRLGRRFIGVFLEGVDPVSRAILAALASARPWPAPRRLGWRALSHLARAAIPVVLAVLGYLLWPTKRRLELGQDIDRELAAVRARYSGAGDLPRLASLIRDTTSALPHRLFHRLFPAVMAGQAPLQVLLRKTAGIPGAKELVLELTRGLEHNVTTEMDLSLWRIAEAVGANPEARAFFRQHPAAELVVAFREGSLPSPARGLVRDFVERYGQRGAGEIDAGRARWGDDPTPLFELLRGYLDIDPSRSPRVVFERGAARAKEAHAELLALCRSTPGHKGAARLAELAVPRLRELGGLRETPKFFVVRLFGEARAALVRLAAPLVAAGRLDRVEDVFFLHLAELEALGRGEPGDWRARIHGRRATFTRELRRRRVPRVMLSDGTAFFDAPAVPGANAAHCLTGSPVSPGVVEGEVRVLREPRGADLAPGEILVCTATDPVWTPLFLTAGGLVMEVGGMMTHGSVVAREYGIPAVVGVEHATTRLRTGQRVRVNGTTGVVELLDDPGRS